MIVLVTGGRDYQDRDLVFTTLTNLNAERFVYLVVHGACCEHDEPLKLRGADRWAHEWALSNELPVLAHPARWGHIGNTAGPIRNELMLKRWKPDLVLAFPGHKGTSHMMKLAKDAGVEVRRVGW